MGVDKNSIKRYHIVFLCIICYNYFTMEGPRPGQEGLNHTKSLVWETGVLPLSEAEYLSVQQKRREADPRRVLEGRMNGNGHTNGDDRTFRESCDRESAHYWVIYRGGQPIAPENIETFYKSAYQEWKDSFVECTVANPGFRIFLNTFEPLQLADSPETALGVQIDTIYSKYRAAEAYNEAFLARIDALYASVANMQSDLPHIHLLAELLYGPDEQFQQLIEETVKQGEEGSGDERKVDGDPDSEKQPDPEQELQQELDDIKEEHNKQEDEAREMTKEEAWTTLKLYGLHGVFATAGIAKTAGEGFLTAVTGGAYDMAFGDTIVDRIYTWIARRARDAALKHIEKEMRKQIKNGEELIETKTAGEILSPLTRRVPGLGPIGEKYPRVRDFAVGSIIDVIPGIMPSAVTVESVYALVNPKNTTNVGRAGRKLTEPLTGPIRRLFGRKK